MSRHETLRNDHQQWLRLTRLVSHLGISMSIISEKPVVTKLVESQQGTTASSPASTSLVTKYSYNRNNPLEWGTRREVYQTTFSAANLPENDPGVWLGTAWHELAHVLWSPFANKQIQITSALNLLEDARIEALLLGTYPNTKGGLMATLGYLLNQPNGSWNTRFHYAWVAGRYHIDKEIRESFRDLVDDPGIAKQIEQIFLKYLSMGVNLETHTANDLARKLTLLLKLEDAPPGVVMCASQESAMKTTNRSASPSYGKLPDELEKDIKDMGSDDTASDGDDTSGSGNDTSDSGNDDTDPSPYGGKEVVVMMRQQRKEIEKLYDKLRKDIKKAVESDAATQAEISALHSILAGNNIHAKQAGQLAPVTPMAAETARKIRRIATRFNDDSAKGLVRRRDHGRIRPVRYERNHDLDTAYDAWEPGLEQEMFVGLLIDTSGSMSGAPINEIVYGLEQGLADVATVETVYFNDSYFVGPGTSTPTRQVSIAATGGTIPGDGMGYLYSRFLKASAANQLFVMYTDGSFNQRSDGELVAAYLTDLQNRGVSIKLLGNSAGRSGLISITQHAPGLTTDIVESLLDLPHVVTKWTTQVLAKPIGGGL